MKIAGSHIGEASALSIRRAREWFGAVMPTLTPQRQEIARRILREIEDRLQFLVDVGLTTSPSRAPRRRSRAARASASGSPRRSAGGLTGVLYVLDEPSIGLHQRDNERLLVTLRRLRDLGNSVIVVEHDEDAIRSADWLVDIGPGAARRAARWCRRARRRRSRTIRRA